MRNLCNAFLESKRRAVERILDPAVCAILWPG
jgi:hypothetical protein